jgi:hypothetical protein
MHIRRSSQRTGTRSGITATYMAPIRTPRERVLLPLAIVLGCLLLVALREPDLLARPRMWAEEGKIFLAFALHHTAWEVLSQPQVGYFTLFNALVSLVQARLFSLEAAATVSTCAGLLVQLLPVLLVVFTSHAFWSTPGRKVACALALVLVTPPELQLNTTNSHFFLGLATFLVLVIPASTLPAATKWLFRGLLVLANLSGPASMLLTPAFLLKAYTERSREKTIQAGIQVACAAFQGCATLYTLLRDNPYRRFSSRDSAASVLGFFTDNFSLGLVGYGLPVALAAGAVSVGYVTFLALRRRRSPEHLVFLSAFAVVAVFSTLGSINMLGSPRYGYLPTCIVMLLAAGEAFRPRSGRMRPAQWFAIVLFAGALAGNAAVFSSRMGEIHSREAPAWKEEVAKWRADRAYKPRIHPAPWFMEP